MAKIYTKTGDAGETGLIGGARVPKNHVRVEAYGTVDEANAALGIILATWDYFTHREELEAMQHMLFEVGAALATEGVRHPTVQAVKVSDTLRPTLRPNDQDITHLENLIDELSATLPPQTKFILPGGSQLAAHLHVARTALRRAERRVVTVSQHQPVLPTIIKYLNRASDYLHVLARAINQERGVADIPWRKS